MFKFQVKYRDGMLKLDSQTTLGENWSSDIMFI